MAGRILWQGEARARHEPLEGMSRTSNDTFTEAPPASAADPIEIVRAGPKILSGVASGVGTGSASIP